MDKLDFQNNIQYYYRLYAAKKKQMQIERLDILFWLNVGINYVAMYSCILALFV